MASRHDMALAMFGNETNLRQIAAALIVAGDEATEDGIAPDQDPAVLLLSCQLAFVTHADSISRRMLRDIITACEVNRELPSPMAFRSH